MPIYEYLCRTCRKPFESLQLSHQAPTPDCPHCGSSEPEKRFSSFARTSESSSPDFSSDLPSCGRCGDRTPNPCQN